MILSKNIHKVTKTDYMWFEVLWIRCYFFIIIEKNIFQCCSDVKCGFFSTVRSFISNTQCVFRNIPQVQNIKKGKCDSFPDFCPVSRNMFHPTLLVNLYHIWTVGFGRGSRIRYCISTILCQRLFSQGTIHILRKHFHKGGFFQKVRFVFQISKS